MVQRMSDIRQAAGEQGSLSRYLRELRKVPLLRGDEEQSCARLAAQGDPTARQRLIEANLRFVILVAKRYRNCGVPLEDLIGEGNIGLIQAAGRYDPERGTHFVSYAIWWIRQAVLKAIHENKRPIRVRGRSAGELSRVEETAQWTISLDSPVMGTEYPDFFGACLEDRSAPKPEEILVGVSLQEQLDALLAGLSDREVRILQDRFGLDGRDRISLQEAGKKHGLSKERVRQIEKKALRKIRASDGVQHLKVYAN